MSGRLIAISGGEGSGKSSVVARLEGVLTTKEPGGTPVGQLIRDLLLHRSEFNPTPWTELFLFFADRAENVGTIIRPALAAGRTVVIDRYWPETFAYEWFAAMGRHDLEPFLELIRLADFPLPDLWIWLDIDPAVGITRRRQTGPLNRFDAKDLAYHQRVRQGFQLLYYQAPCRVLRVDASQPLEAVVAAVKQAIGQP